MRRFVNRSVPPAGAANRAWYRPALTRSADPDRARKMKGASATGDPSSPISTQIAPTTWAAHARPVMTAAKWASS